MEAPSWSLFDDPADHRAWEDYEDVVSEHEGAVEARDRAIERVERGADPLWIEEALAAVKAVAYAEPFLTSEDAADFINRTTPEPRALGAVMRMASDQGWIEATERWVPARHAKAHKRPMRVWKSRICVERAA